MTRLFGLTSAAPLLLAGFVVLPSAASQVQVPLAAARAEGRPEGLGVVVLRSEGDELEARRIDLDEVGEANLVLPAETSWEACVEVEGRWAPCQSLEISAETTIEFLTWPAGKLSGTLKPPVIRFEGETDSSSRRDRGQVVILLDGIPLSQQRLWQWSRGHGVTWQFGSESLARPSHRISRREAVGCCRCKASGGAATSPYSTYCEECRRRITQQIQRHTASQQKGGEKVGLEVPRMAPGQYTACVMTEADYLAAAASQRDWRQDQPTCESGTLSDGAVLELSVSAPDPEPSEGKDR